MVTSERFRVISIEKANDNKLVIDYVPKKISVGMSFSAKEFEKTQNHDVRPFQMNELVAEVTGVANKRRLESEEKIEAEVLTKLKDVEENAYKEAYELGILEGAEKAFRDKSSEINDKLNYLDSLFNQINNLTKELFIEKENQILKLITTLASSIALFEISTKKENIKDLMRDLIDQMQTDEKVIVKLAPADVEFIKTAHEKIDSEFTIASNVKLETDKHMSSGECIIESNYGAIDASIETRVQRAWGAIEEGLPHVSEARNEISTSNEDSSNDNSGSEESE